jgi:hypothetical protein
MPRPSPTAVLPALPPLRWPLRLGAALAIGCADAEKPEGGDGVAEDTGGGGADGADGGPVDTGGADGGDGPGYTRLEGAMEVQRLRDGAAARWSAIGVAAEPAACPDCAFVFDVRYDLDPSSDFGASLQWVVGHVEGVDGGGYAVYLMGEELMYWGAASVSADGAWHIEHSYADALGEVLYTYVQDHQLR